MTRYTDKDAARELGVCKTTLGNIKETLRNRGLLKRGDGLDDVTIKLVKEAQAYRTSPTVRWADAIDYATGNHHVEKQVERLSMIMTGDNSAGYHADQILQEHCGEAYDRALLASNEVGDFLRAAGLDSLHDYWSKMMDVVFHAAAFDISHAAKKEEVSESGEGKLPLETKIEEFDFSVRTYNRLKRAGKETLGSILDLTLKELDDLKSKGNYLIDCMFEVDAALQRYGFKLDLS